MSSELPEPSPRETSASTNPGGWLPLQDCRLGSHALPLVLLHPRRGVVIVGGPADAPKLLHQRLERARFPTIFPGHLPVVRLASADVPPDLAFDGMPPLSLPGGDAWMSAAERALRTDAPQGQPLPLGTRGRRRRHRRRATLLAAAVAILLGGVGIGLAILPAVPKLAPLARQGSAARLAEGLQSRDAAPVPARCRQMAGRLQGQGRVPDGDIRFARPGCPG